MVALGGIRTNDGRSYSLVRDDYQRLALLARWRVMSVDALLRWEWPQERWDGSHAPRDEAGLAAWLASYDSRVRYLRRRLRLYSRTLPRPLAVNVAAVDRGRVWSAGPGVSLLGLHPSGEVSPFVTPHALACSEVGRQFALLGHQSVSEGDIRRAAREGLAPAVAGLAARGVDGEMCWPDLGVPDLGLAVEVERLPNRSLAHYREKTAAYAYGETTARRVLWVCETPRVARRVRAALHDVDAGALDVVVVVADQTPGWWWLDLPVDVRRRWLDASPVAA